MGRLILDSVALIAIFKDVDIHHESIMNRLSEGSEEVVLSAITLTESLVHAYQLGFGEIGKQQIYDLALEIIDVDQEIAIRAAELRAVHNLKLGDALISATAILHKCTLLTFDEKLARNTPGAELLVS